MTRPEPFGAEVENVQAVSAAIDKEQPGGVQWTV